MARKTPQVEDGLRKPVDRSGSPISEPESAAQYRDLRAQQRVAPEGVVIYQSAARRFRAQLTAPMDRIDPVTGAVSRFPAIAAQFEDGEYRTSDPEIIRLLESRRYYGINKDFWRAEDLRVAALQKTADDLVTTVRNTADPELAARLIAELAPVAGVDFVLPAKAPADNESPGA